MVLYVLSNPKKIGGVFQWEQFINDSLVIYDPNRNFESGDIIYVNNYATNDFFNKFFLQKLNDIGVKIFFVFHSDLCPINKFYIQFQKYFFGVISTNLHVKNKISKLYPAIENLYIPNISKIIPENITKNSDEKRIHYVGRLSPEKNLPMLFCAMYFLPDIKLYIYGEYKVKYYDYLKKLCLLLKLKNIIFMGHSDDKYDLYNNANCVILPSVHEGLPYCLLEAEAYSIPVIYNNISNISLHLKNKLNISYVYNGYSNELNNILHVDNYLQLLKSIGYMEYIIDVKSMINLNKNDIDKSDLKLSTLKSLIACHSDKITVGEKYIVPPFLLKNTKEQNIYESNVNLIVMSINKFFNSYHKN